MCKFVVYLLLIQWEKYTLFLVEKQKLADNIQRWKDTIQWKWNPVTEKIPNSLCSFAIFRWVLATFFHSSSFFHKRNIFVRYKKLFWLRESMTESICFIKMNDFLRPRSKRFQFDWEAFLLNRRKKMFCVLISEKKMDLFYFLCHACESPFFNWKLINWNRWYTTRMSFLHSNGHRFRLNWTLFFVWQRRNLFSMHFNQWK